MKRPRLNRAFKITLAWGIILLASVFFIGYIWKALKVSEYFRISDIVIRGASQEKLDYLKGRNIFNLDTRQESLNILVGCPDCSSVRLVKVLPGRLFVDFVQRKPVAVVKLYRYYALDKDGVLFVAGQDTVGGQLPVITGLETKIFGPKPGRRYNQKEVELALETIREFTKNRLLKDLRLHKIDVANAANASIFIQTDAQPPGERMLEVKIGWDNIRDKMSILGKLIAASRADLANIKYIDLNFKDPVIKLEDAKPKR